ncbi:MAG TPA: acyl carrier protein [Acidimicrobiales bacterium]|jgi:acyl carrier protein
MTSISGTTETGSSNPSSNGDQVSDVAGRVRGFLVDSFLLGDDDGFANDESLLDSGIVDSTGVMEVVTFLEESFGISIDDEELIADNLDSVDRLSGFVHRKLAS